MTVKDLAGYLRIHPSTIYHQLKLGQLPAFKVGSDWRFNRESIDRWRFQQDGASARAGVGGRKPKPRLTARKAAGVRA
jgi:excisionase family DNA binding protein